MIGGSVDVAVGVGVGVFVGVGVGVGVGQYGSRRLLRSLVDMVLRPGGMQPVNLLEPASRKERRLVSFSKVAGMEPVRRLPLSPRCSSRFRSPRWDGMEPCRRLFLRSSRVRYTIVRSCVGTRPVSPLFTNEISVTRRMRPTVLTLIPSHCVMGMLVLQLSVPDPARLSFIPSSVTQSIASLELLE